MSPVRTFARLAWVLFVSPLSDGALSSSQSWSIILTALYTFGCGTALRSSRGVALRVGTALRAKFHFQRI